MNEFLKRMDLAKGTEYVWAVRRHDCHAAQAAGNGDNNIVNITHFLQAY